eukprot:gene34229-44219_t
MSSKIVFDEIEAENWQIVKELIATTNYLTRTDLEEKHGVGATPLIISARQGHSEVAALLIHRGVDIEARTNVMRVAWMQ